MAIIDIPNTFADGVAADAEEVSENTYLPKVTPDNPEVINGRLSNTNRDGWDISREDVRRGHFSQSGMVSATANQDFFDDFFKDTDVNSEWSGDALPIPGCGISFHVPWAVTAVVFTWHISLITDAGYLSYQKDTADTASPYGSHFTQGDTKIMLYINGYPIEAVQRAIIDGGSTMAYDPAVPATYHNRYNKPDTRNWTGSFLFDAAVGGKLIAQIPITSWPIFGPSPTTLGWHTADLRIAFTKYTPVSLLPPAPSKGIKQVRVKTRRMGYTLIR